MRTASVVGMALLLSCTGAQPKDFSLVGDWASQFPVEGRAETDGRFWIAALANDKFGLEPTMNNEFQDTFKENAWVLEDMKAKGVDLSKERTMDFAHVFNAEKHAKAFADATITQGFSAKLFPRNDGDYDVIVSLPMVPEVERITSLELELGKLSRHFHGHPDGWGFTDDDHVVKH